MFIQLFNLVQKSKSQTWHKTKVISNGNFLALRNTIRNQEKKWITLKIVIPKTNTCIKLDLLVSLYLKRSDHILESCCTKWTDMNHGSNTRDVNWNKAEDYQTLKRGLIIRFFLKTFNWPEHPDWDMNQIITFQIMQFVGVQAIKNKSEYNYAQNQIWASSLNIGRYWISVKLQCNNIGKMRYTCNFMFLGIIPI